MSGAERASEADDLASGVARLLRRPDPEAHWAGTVTTGAAALSPVPEIENSSITNAKLYLDWMSVSGIQNQRPWYSTAT